MIKPLFCLLSFAAAAFAQTDCTFTLTPPGNTDVPRSGGRFSNNQIAASRPDCAWTVRGPEWVNIDQGQSGTGNGVFVYSIGPNTSFLARSAYIQAGNQLFPVVQLGCTYQVGPANVYSPDSGGEGQFQVASDCDWEAVSTVPWLRTQSTGSGGGTVTFTIDPNTTGNGRSGSIRVGPPGSTDLLSAVFNVTQGGDVLLPRAVTLAAGASSGSFAVSFRPEVTWTATSQAPWITVVSGGSGSGQGRVNYQVQANPSAQPRSAAILVNALAFTITQEGNACTYEISPATISISGDGGSGTLNLATRCDWSASTDVSWLAAVPDSGRENSVITFTALPNPANTERTGVLTIGGQPFAVTQAARGCEFKISPGSAAFGPEGGSGLLQVGTAAGCAWTPSRSESWIEILQTSGAELGYVVYPNPSSQERSASLSIGGTVFPITQRGRGPQISTAGVVNAASYIGGPVAPGELITIFGQAIGPPELVTLQLTEAGVVSTDLAGTRVFFDDIPAPLVYVSETQVSAIVPYAAAGRSSVELRVEYRGGITNRVRMGVAQAAPALFTLDASGGGPGAILNADYSLNEAANPAARGSYVLLYGTGAGETIPQGVDGTIAGGELPTPRLRVTAQIGGVDADVLYAGAAPDLVSGVIQINVQIPESVTPGPAVPVQIRVGEFASRPDVTLAVRE